jgi:hypothetical protein
MTGGNVAYLLLVVGSFLAFSGALFYASTQTLEAEADPNIPTGKTNPDAQRDHDWSIRLFGLTLDRPAGSDEAPQRRAELEAFQTV